MHSGVDGPGTWSCTAEPAPPDRPPADIKTVFHARTQLHHLKKWSYPEGATVEDTAVDLSMGGLDRVAMGTENVATTAYGKYREIDNPKRLLYTWAREAGDVEVGGSVRLILGGRMLKPFILTFLLLVGVLPGGAQEITPEEAVKRAVAGFFDALREKDEAGLRGALAPGARLIGIRTVDGEPVLQITEFEDFIPRVLASEAQMDERDYDIRVEIRDDLANVWQRFNMFINGSLSHCGSEVIHLFHFPEGWKILHLSETITSEGCEAHRTPGS